jgi:hypothetical protein
LFFTLFFKKRFSLFCIIRFHLTTYFPTSVS